MSLDFSIPPPYLQALKVFGSHGPLGGSPGLEANRLDLLLYSGTGGRPTAQSCAFVLGGLDLEPLPLEDRRPSLRKKLRHHRLQRLQA
jgi:hypothetical protein